MKKEISTSPQQQQRLTLKLLHPHPLQAAYYCQTSQGDDDRLVEDLRENGQRDALVVVPMKGNAGHYLILDGHRRVSAAKVLRWDDIEAIIRHDLADDEESAIEAEFLKFNLNRRQLHKLDQARIVLRLYEIEKNRPRGRFLITDQQEARDRVGKILGMSGRNLHRYFNVLLASPEIQNAVRDGQLKLTTGCRVVGLSRSQQNEITTRITDGEDPESVVAAYLPPSNGRHRKAGDVFKNLEWALSDLENHRDELSHMALKKNRPLLERGQQLISTLIADGGTQREAIDKLVKDFSKQQHNGQGVGGNKTQPKRRTRCPS
jgi:ParB/RepB/Spo0J family partition protein